MNLAFVGMAAALGLSASGSAFGAGSVSYTHLVHLVQVEKDISEFPTHIHWTI